MSSRPSSARPSINPITGEEMLHTPRVTQKPEQLKHPQHIAYYPPRPKSRPDVVPPLNLGSFASEDTETFEPGIQGLSSRSAATTVSWGTPTSAYERVQQAQKELAAAVLSQEKALQLKLDESSQNPVPTPRNEPPLALPYTEEFPESLTERVSRLESVIPSYEHVSKREDYFSAQQKSSSVGKTSSQFVPSEIKKADKESLLEENQRLKILETVMIDQLSRAVISDPEQDQMNSARSTGTKRSLHTSKVKTSGSATENLLSKKIQFGARILSRNNRDAIRELTGFYFAVDNSLTVYEFRQFGKCSKALPFIKRGRYPCLQGCRQGQPYTVQDILKGNILRIKWADQPVPDTVKDTEVMLLKITSVDDAAKAAIILEGVKGPDRDDVWRRAHLPSNSEEFREKLLCKEVHDIVRSQLKTRGIKVYTGIGRQLRNLARAAGENGRLNRYDLEKTLLDFHIEIPQDKFDDLWECVDVGCTSFLDYDEFMRTFLGQMSEDRKTLVRKAFAKIDASRKGVVTVEDISKFCNCRMHPKVKSGECSEREVFSAFVASFQDQRQARPMSARDMGLMQVSFAEFEEYYEGLSISISDDEEFAKMMKTEWGI